MEGIAFIGRRRRRRRRPFLWCGDAMARVSLVPPSGRSTLLIFFSGPYIDYRRCRRCRLPILFCFVFFLCPFKCLQHFWSSSSSREYTYSNTSLVVVAMCPLWLLVDWSFSSLGTFNRRVSSSCPLLFWNNFKTIKIDTKFCFVLFSFFICTHNGSPNRIFVIVIVDALSSQ
jgi:hypothetical protein